MLIFIYSVKYTDLNPRKIVGILKVDVEAGLLEQCHASLAVLIPGTVPGTGVLMTPQTLSLTLMAAWRQG